MGSHYGEETVVQCSQDYNNTDENDEFLLNFNGNTSVTIEGVRFTGCAQPLFFNGTANVTIKDSHFRYCIYTFPVPLF